MKTTPISVPPSRTFRVDNVAPANEPIWTETLLANLSKRFCRKVLLLPDAGRPVVNTVMQKLASLHGASELPTEGMVSRTHPFVEAVTTAFAQHRQLTLSPDSIWLVISQGFTQHIKTNAEKLRERLVRHRGKKELTVEIRSLSLASFAHAIASFSQQIKDASDPVLHATLLCDFTTTDPNVRTASEVVLMDTYSSYFTYRLEFICGIPKVTLTGSVEDWQRIRDRVEVLATYELEWWICRLRPILDEFVRTAMGQPDRGFWQAICKPKDAYAATMITGWLADLFPYLGEAPKLRRSHVFDFDRKRWALPVEGGIDTSPSEWNVGTGKGVSTDAFPCGLSSVPVAATNGSKTNKLDLVAGFLATEQNPEDLALSPVIGWCLAEEPPSTPVVI